MTRTKEYFNKRYLYSVDDFGIHRRKTRTWYKPMHWFGNKLKRVLYLLGAKTYSKSIWWVRNHITND